jgi:hydroxymethylpyrimidine/phosphomethylpyrimidine kinase
MFYDGWNELLLSARRVRNVQTHGTGCTYSAAIAAHLAAGAKLRESVVRAKEFISRAIAQSGTTAGHSVLRQVPE